MRLEEYLSNIKVANDTAFTIGIFDGVHRGHQYLISCVVDKARENGTLSGVITFTEHPKEVLGYQNNVLLLTTVEERLKLLGEQGVDIILPLPFSREIAQLGAEEFLGQLKKYLRMRVLVMGPDSALGHDRQGDAIVLKQLAGQMGFDFIVVSPISIDGEIVSSSRIRQTLAQGDTKSANRMLGRFFSISGPVIKGRGRGRHIGFPTANIDPDPSLLLPANGVYASLVRLDGQVYPSVTNIGERPTFESEGRTVEVHLIGFQGDLYSEMLRIDIIDRLREERKFACPDDLRDQIIRDISQAEEILKKVSG